MAISWTLTEMTFDQFCVVWLLTSVWCGVMILIHKLDEWWYTRKRGNHGDD